MSLKNPHIMRRNICLKNISEFLIKKLIILFPVLMLCACAEKQASSAGEGSYVETGFIPALPGNYDSADTAALVDKDPEGRTLSFLNFDNGRRYTLSADGATCFYDRYGEAMSFDELQTGSIADLTFMHDRKRLNTLKLSSEAFSFEIPAGTDLGGKNVRVTNAGKEYVLDEKAAVILASGRGERLDLNDADVLQASGVGRRIYALKVMRGHGYLRLENTSAFEGGFIQVGDDYIRQIEKDMLLAVPEGANEVWVSKGGVTGKESILLSSGQEISIDLSKFQAAPMYGGVIFTVSPEKTSIYIDGEKKDISQEVMLSYGLHQMVARAEGYKTLTRYIRVAESHASLGVTLEEASAVSGNTVSADSAYASLSEDTAPENSISADQVSVDAAAPEESVSADTYATLTPGEYRVYIDGPEGVEVYKDGSYIGISPISFAKEKGDHVITLRRSGYHTRSYTVSIDGENKDVTYTFSELEAIGDGE